ncbi:hypothetical protein GCM10017687_67510 [Streptomyces echinatus]
MKAFRGPKVWLWRWRRNPLKRRADVVEAWVVLGACLLTVLAGVLAGLAAAGSVERGLARERAERRPVVARIVALVPGSSPAQNSHASAGERIWTKVRWTAADGSAHTGQVRVEPGSRAGTPVTVWTDPGGPAPLPAHQRVRGRLPGHPDRPPGRRERRRRPLRRRPDRTGPTGAPAHGRLGHGMVPTRPAVGPHGLTRPRILTNAHRSPHR